MTVIDKVRMNELNRGNTRVGTVTSLISLASSVDLHLRVVAATSAVQPPRLRDLAVCNALCVLQTFN